jgi:hypothetical protein
MNNIEVVAFYLVVNMGINGIVTINGGDWQGEN